MSASNVVVCVWIQEKGSIKEDIEVAGLSVLSLDK